MKKTKTLIASLVAIVVCFAMLIGTTYAWFTDSVINTNNIIKSGNVDVELWHASNSKTEYEEVTGTTKLFVNVDGDSILWEPGASTSEKFQVKNVGSLALKYEFRIKAVAKTATAEGKTLTDVLTLKVNGDNNVDYTELFGEGYAVESELLANEDENYTVSISWDKDALNNNDYNVKGGLKLTLGIELVATQLNYESDGLGSDFDDSAEYPNVSSDVKFGELGDVEEGVVLETKGEKPVSVSVSKSIIDTLKEQKVKSISLVHTEPIVENGTIIFESIEIVDQDGNIVDLKELNLTDKFKVTLPAQETFDPNTQVAIYHDDEFVYMATVDADGVISYEVEHFCELTIKSAEKFAEAMVEDTNGKNYEVQNLAQLINFQQRVNGGETFSGKTVKLVADIDLENVVWTPIGNSKNAFQGTFDGGFNTISNLNCVMEGKSDVGLFGKTTTGEIKNLTVENANVAGYLNVGVIAGTPYTSKYNNITVIGHVEVNGFSYVGAVGGKNVYADWNNIVVNVDETSYVYANSIAGEIAYRTYVGGVIGFMGEGNHVISNVISNIDVKGSSADVGGITGIAHYGNTFKNCIATGDVEIFDATEIADAEEMGGIAGVWHNGGANVSILNCAFTGELKANVEAALSNNTLTGNAYSASGKGELVTGETAIVSTADELVEALANDEVTYIVLANDITIDPANMSNAYGKTGINIKKNQILNGAGYTLDIHGAGGTWDSGINITGGAIMNITITGSFRGIFINHNSDTSGPVVLVNVTTTGTVYTISCDQGTNNGLTAINCNFNGWTSFAATLGNARFFDCNFAEGSGYAYCRPYAPTEFVGCAFEAGFELDACAAVSFKNCTLGGDALTADNLSVLVTSNLQNASVKQ